MNRRIEIESKDPWSFVRDHPNVMGLVPAPTTRATVHIAPSEGVRVGWSLFWRSLWWTIRRRKSFEFWVEGES